MLIKKVIVVLLIIGMILGINIHSIRALEYETYGIIINNIFINKSNYIKVFDNIVYINLDLIKSEIDITVNNTSSYLEIKNSDKNLLIDIQKNQYYLNQSQIYLNYHFISKDNHTYMPLIYLIDIMDYDIQVIEDIKHIRIITDKVNSKLDADIIEKYYLKNTVTKVKDEEKKIENNKEKNTNEEEKVKKHVYKVYLPDEVVEEKNNKKVAYLTFDDGINKKITPKILDILKEYKVKATFFIIGNTIDNNRSLLRRIINEGHSIGNHTYTHNKKLLYNNIDNFKAELDKTSKIIYEVTKKIVKLFRPPYGGTYIKDKKYKKILTHYKTVLWNIDSKDSSSRHIKKEDIIDSVIKQVHNKKSAIIIMHDSYTHNETVKALPGIIKYLTKNKFTIKAINENTKLYYEF